MKVQLKKKELYSKHRLISTGGGLNYEVEYYVHLSIVSWNNNVKPMSK